MHQAIIQKSFLRGTISAPSSKSFSHRAIICAALAGGECFISPLVFSQDILATINGMKSLGAGIEIFENGIKIKNFKNIGITKEEDQWERLYLNNSLDKDKIGELIILIGENNVGKSNILDAINTISLT